MSEQQKDPWMNEGGPAFPTSDGMEKNYKGMSLRDYFAIEALNARISAMSGLYDPIYVAEQAYELADAMLKVRSEQ